MTRTSHSSVTASKTSDIMLVTLTVSDLITIIEEATERVANNIISKTMQKTPEYASSLKEAATRLGVSPSTMQKIRNSGIIDEALYIYGHNIMVNIDTARDALKQHNKISKQI